MKEIIYINGKIVNRSSSKISIFDHGFLYGVAVFESMRAYSGKVFCLDEHIERLYKSLSRAKIGIKIKKPNLIALINTLMIKSRLNDAYVRVMITQGTGDTGLTSVCKKPTLIIFIKKMNFYQKNFYKKGVSLKTSKIIVNPHDILHSIKSSNYLVNFLARVESAKENYYDAIFFNTKNYATETTTSNIFLIKNRCLFTPMEECGLLAGITRQAILNLAKTFLKTKCTNITLKDLNEADEVFISNSINEIVGVIKINKKIIGNGRVGCITKQIHSLYRRAALS